MNAVRVLVDVLNVESADCAGAIPKKANVNAKEITNAFFMFSP